MAVDNYDYPDGTLGQDLPDYTVWSGNFEVQGGALTVSTSTANSRIARPSYSDGTWVANIRIDSVSTQNVGVNFRGIDSLNYWSFYYNTSQGRTRLASYTNGSGTTVYDEFNGSYTGTGERLLKVRAVGETIEFYINDELLGTHTSSTHSAGTLTGFRLDSTSYFVEDFSYQSTQIPTAQPRAEYIQSGMGLSASKVGQIATIHSQIVANGDAEEFWPYGVETSQITGWPSVKYPVIMYSSSDHSTSSGGIYVRVYNSELGDITSPSSWEEWQNVSGRTEFDHISTKTCPIYVDADFFQTETPTVIVENGNVRMFYHTGGVNNLGYPISVQNTHLATGTNGIDFTKTKSSVVTYNPRLEQGDGHTGYLNIKLNPFSNPSHTWLANTTHGGGALSRAPTQAFWGSNDLENWELISEFGRQQGEIVEYAPDLGVTWIYTLQSVATLKKEGPYWRMVVNLRKDVVTGGDDTPYFPCEVLIDESFNVVSAPSFFTSLGASGEFDQNEMQHYNEFEYNGNTYALYKAADGSNVASIGMLQVSEAAKDWAIIRSHKDATKIQSNGVSDYSGLTASANTSLTDNGDTVSFSLPSSGDEAYVESSPITLDSYGMVDIMFNRSGKVGTQDISGYVGLFDDVQDPNQAISLAWPSEADGTRLLRARFVESGSETMEDTRKVIGMNSDGGLSNQYEDPRSKQVYGIRIMPAERVMYVMDGKSPTSKHLLMGVDTSIPLKPGMIFKTNDASEGSFEFQDVTVTTYSNEQIIANPAPTITVTQSDSSPTVGDTVTFNATVTDTNSVSWASTGGVSLNSNTGTSVTAEVTAEGAYSVTATALGDGGTSGDTVNGTAQAAPVNQPPTANAGTNQSVAAGATVQLDGTGSTDGDGTIVSYAWSQTGGDAVILTGATTATPSFTAPSTNAAQTLSFDLTVTDNEALTATDSVSVDVAAATQIIRPFINNASRNFNFVDSDGLWTDKLRVTEIDSYTLTIDPNWISPEEVISYSVTPKEGLTVVAHARQDNVIQVYLTAAVVGRTSVRFDFETATRSDHVVVSLDVIS